MFQLKKRFLTENCINFLFALTPPYACCSLVYVGVRTIGCVRMANYIFVLQDGGLGPPAEFSNNNDDMYDDDDVDDDSDDECDDLSQDSKYH